MDQDTRLRELQRHLREVQGKGVHVLVCGSSARVFEPGWDLDWLPAGRRQNSHRFHVEALWTAQGVDRPSLQVRRQTRDTSIQCREVCSVPLGRIAKGARNK